MNRLAYLLGGALVGAVGLTAAALLNKKNSDSLTPGKIKALDADDLTGQLHSYFSRPMPLP